MDLELRNEPYRQIVVRGRVPKAVEVAAATGRSEASVREGWQHLHEAHALVLDPSGAEILMANPFAAVPTAYRGVRSALMWLVSSSCLPLLRPVPAVEAGDLARL